MRQADTRCRWDPAGGGRLGTDALDTYACKLRSDAKNYAEGFRLQEAADDPEQNAKCLDGSAPLYYIKRGSGTGQNRWCAGSKRPRTGTLPHHQATALSRFAGSRGAAMHVST